MHLIFGLVFVAFISILSACSISSELDPKKPNQVVSKNSDESYQITSATPTLILDGNDNGKTIELVQGQFIEIKLKSNKTTGYRWWLNDQSTNLIERQGDGGVFVIDADCGSRMGCGGEETWKFKATKQGSGKVYLNYSRASVPPASASNISDFQLTITVR